MDILPLVVKVGTGELDKLNDKLKDAKKGFEETESAGFKVGFAIGESFKVAATAAVSLVTAIGGLTIALGAHLDDLGDLGEMYGFNAIQIAAMKSAAEGAGGSLELVTGAAQRASKELAKGGEAYKALGISIRGANGELKSGAELANEVAEAYLKGSTTAAQFADVQKVLGKDVDKAAASIRAANEGLALADELHQQGIGVVKGSAEAWDEFEKQKRKSMVTYTALSSILVAKVLPIINEVTKAFSEGSKEGGFVKLAIDGIVESLPGLIQFGADVAKIFLTAFNVVRAFGQTLGAAAAALVAVASGDFKGAAEIGKAWKETIDDIDASNKKGIAGIQRVADAAAKASRDSSLALQDLGKGKLTGGGEDPVSKRAQREPGESNIVGKINAEADAITKLKGKIDELNGVQAATNVQLVQAAIVRGDYDAKLKDGVVVRLGATDAQKQALLAGAAEQDQLIAMVELLKRQNDERKKQEEASTKAWEAAIKVTEQAQQEVEISRIKIKVMQDLNATTGDVAVAVAEYKLQLIDEKIALAAKNPEAEAELNLLRAKRAELVAMKNAAVATNKDDKDETARQQTFEFGWNKAFASFKKDASDAAKTGEQVFNSLTSNMEGAIEKLLTTGKLNFKDFARSIIADMIKIIAKQMVLRALGFVFGGVSGGAAGGIPAGMSPETLALAGLATGTNYVPSDNFPAVLHKGEAVVPAKYNPAAGGTAPGSGLTINKIEVNVQGGNTNAETGKVVADAMEQRFKSMIKEGIATEKNYGGMLYAG